MKITDNRKEKDFLCFGDIGSGTVFIDDEGDICMKTDEYAPNNAIVLKDGIIFEMSSGDKITLVNAELIIS